MTSQWPYWCSKAILWELTSFLVQTISFVPVNLRRCCPSEWKRSIGHLLVAPNLCFKARLSAKPVYEYKNHFYLKGFALSLFSASDRTLANPPPPPPLTHTYSYILLGLFSRPRKGIFPDPAKSSGYPCNPDIFLLFYFIASKTKRRKKIHGVNWKKKWHGIGKLK